jgi:poly-gamma-glutamate synthesis protein (capsule biosynthesis protein)
MQKIILIIIGLIIFMGIVGGIWYLDNSLLKEIIIFNSDQTTYSDNAVFPIAGGIVPHHLLAKEIIQNFFEYISLKENPETIILLSPDHFNSGGFNEEKSFITYSPDNERNNDFEIDKTVLQNIIEENKIVFNNSAINFDHGITNLLPFIQEYFPNSKILPILIPSKINKKQTEEFINKIDSYAPSKTIIIASVDFSHYLPKNAADFHDIKSISTLIDFKAEDFENLEVDCWQCLYGARLFAKLRNKEFPKIIAHKNSADFSRIDNIKETTSYFSVVFEKENLKEIGKNQNTENFSLPLENDLKTKTIIFVGDIMLDRAVERLMKKNSFLYPFEKISQFLKGTDLTFGNLEGPIVKNPPNFSDDSLQFAFYPEAIEGLKFANFNLLSLANNHTLNMGKSGLKQTREFLKKENINFVGDPLKCGDEFLFQKDKIIFFAFNKTFPSNCPNEEIIETIKSVKTQNSENFLIVSVHWGNEYQIKSSAFQQKLARKIIDVGADLIIGHHPHVVQEIEIYNNKLIFYSLGNFVFDQYFSEQTQQGLAVGLEINENKLVFRLFPIQSKLSQPFLMEQDQAKKFLEKLSERSSEDLAEEIKKGVIEIKLK